MKTYRVLFTLLILLIGITPPASLKAYSTDITAIYRINGYYYGVWELGASGIYKAYLTGNNTDFSSGHLSIHYIFEYTMDIVIGEYDYIIRYFFRLNNYTIDSLGFDKSFVESFRSELNKYLNKIFYRESKWVDLPIVFTFIPPDIVYFESITRYYNATGISLYNDVLCFEYSIFYEKTLNHYINRSVLSLYYDIISGTPLYMYKYDQTTDLYNDVNYMYTKLVITEEGVSVGLSKISFSETFYLYFEKGYKGRLSIIYYSSYDKLNISSYNNTIKLVFKSSGPYRVILILDKEIAIIDSTVDLTQIPADDKVLYVSPIKYKGTSYVFILNSPVDEILDKQNTYEFVHEVTIESRNPSSLYVALALITINLLAFLVVYVISRVVTDVFAQAVSS
ncbi:MAG: hypothetical protein ABWW65_07820 [Thermoprotei archaeon]